MERRDNRVLVRRVPRPQTSNGRQQFGFERTTGHVGCAYSDRMRNELTSGLERGDSDSLVLQSFVQKYGNTVLAAPTQSGFNIVAWITPFAVFLLATAIAVWLVRMWRARPLSQPVAHPNLPATELDALRRKAREETEF